ncbi:MAG: SMC-Scp complex subunit ScpB [Gammaproteobacteria bacterium]|nr:SMC-Scp complex subunit ScpB [Gammaproteobacteria bacterium]
MEKEQLKPVLEAVLMASSQPLSVDALIKLFPENEQPEKDDVNAALEEMVNECEGRSYELKEVRSGYRFQVRKDYADYVTRLWEEKPARYSRALLETIALIAYKQPITRGEIEAVRGVSVSSQIIKTLDERGWIKIVGHRDVPGRPSLYATTKEFLDYFNLKSLDDLPSLQEIRDIDQINAELDLRLPDAEEQNQTEESDAAVINLESDTADESVEEQNNPPTYEAAPASVEN